MKTLKNNIIALLILMSTTMFAQIDTITWQQCFGTTGTAAQDYAQGAIKFNDGYLFGIGAKQNEPWISNYHGETDVWLVMTDTIGNVLWENCYGGSESESPDKIIPIDSNYIYLINGTESTDGDVHNFTNDKYDIWVVKLNRQGDIIWENCYGGPGVEEPRDVLLTPDGGLILMSRFATVGGNISVHYGSVDIWICKIDSLGNIEWEKTLGNHGTENAITMEFASDTSFFVLAGINETGGMVDCDCNIHPTGSLDVWLVEMDMQGNIIRQLCYGGTGHELVRDIVKTEDGYVFTASTNSYDGDVSGVHGGKDIWVVKIDNDGNLVWQNCLGGSENEWPMYITQTQDSGFMIIGNTLSYNGDVSNNHSGFGYFDIWVVKLDKKGILLWEHCFGGIGDEKIWSPNNIIKNGDYDFVVAIQSQGISGDVECELEPNSNLSPDAWVINIKDCSLYQPTIPQKPTGKDTLCVNTDSITTYTTTLAANAWYYEWELEPSEAGIFSQDSLTNTIHWNPNYEGPATIKVRSISDCGESAWSDSLIIQTFMCLGTEENNFANKLRVYPNPATSTLFVELENCTQQSYNIEVYNSVGSSVFSSKVLNKNTTIDVSNWNNGIYVVKVLSGKNNYSRKVVIR